MHRTPTIARAALAGTLVGTAAAVVLWALVAVVTASGEHDAAAGLAAAALAVAPVVVVGSALFGLAAGSVLVAAAPALDRGGVPRTVALVVVGLLSFAGWGIATAQLVTKEAFVVGGLVSTDTVQLVTTALGAVAGAGVVVVAARGRLPLPDAGAGRTVVRWVVVGALLGVLAWWVRRSGVPLLTGMPADGAFVGAGFGDSELPIRLEWVWALVTGAVAGWILAVVEVLTARRWAVVTTAAVLAAVAAFVSAVTGLVFPTLGEHPFAATYPIVGGFATSVAHLPLAAVLVTVVLWAAVAAAVAGAVTTAVARGRDRGGRASRPV